MSNDIAIRIEGLGKRYRYGGAAPLSANLRADIGDWIKGLCRRDRRPKTLDVRPNSASGVSVSPKSDVCGLKSDVSHRPTLHEIHEEHLAHDPQYFWALKDINLEVRTGEVVGIIGRNGAGKSTLLKILSRITPPTTGKITYNGRIASLLEVGTGFHRELTGRENIFLNGSILGMKRAEIAKKFDEIVAFAEVEKFIDTPVKFYSSGMYVRLAFAVAAHLEPEILVVDEVLAVGDAEFQKKCLGKMGDVAKQGRTVLFVSHNMTAMRALCQTGALLRKGSLEFAGQIGKCIGQYTTLQGIAPSTIWKRTESDQPVLAIQEVSGALLGKQPQHLLRVDVALESTRSHKPAFLALDIRDAAGVQVMQPMPTVERFLLHERRYHRVGLTVHLPPLIPGRYCLGVWVGSHFSETLDQVNDCLTFDVLDSPTPNRTHPHSPERGYIVPHTDWDYNTTSLWTSEKQS